MSSKRRQLGPWDEEEIDLFRAAFRYVDDAGGSQPSGLDGAEVHKFERFNRQKLFARWFELIGANAKTTEDPLDDPSRFLQLLELEGLVTPGEMTAIIRDNVGCGRMLTNYLCYHMPDELKDENYNIRLKLSLGSQRTKFDEQVDIDTWPSTTPRLNFSYTASPFRDHPSPYWQTLKGWSGHLAPWLASTTGKTVTERDTLQLIAESAGVDMLALQGFVPPLDGIDAEMAADNVAEVVALLAGLAGEVDAKGRKQLFEALQGQGRQHFAKVTGIDVEAGLAACPRDERHWGQWLRMLRLNAGNNRGELRRGFLRATHQDMGKQMNKRIYRYEIDMIPKNSFHIWQLGGVLGLEGEARWAFFDRAGLERLQQNERRSQDKDHDPKMFRRHLRCHTVTFGDQLTMMMEERNLSSGDVARMFPKKVDDRTVRSWKLGERLCSAENLQHLLTCFTTQGSLETSEDSRILLERWLTEKLQSKTRKPTAAELHELRGHAHSLNIDWNPNIEELEKAKRLRKGTQSPSSDVGHVSWRKRVDEGGQGQTPDFPSH